MRPQEFLGFKLELNGKHALHSLISKYSNHYPWWARCMELFYFRVNLHACSRNWIIWKLVIDCFGLVRSGQNKIGSVQGQGHKILFYFWSSPGLAKDNRALRVGVSITFAPQDFNVFLSSHLSTNCQPFIWNLLMNALVLENTLSVFA